MIIDTTNAGNVAYKPIVTMGRLMDLQPDDEGATTRKSKMERLSVKLIPAATPANMCDASVIVNTKTNVKNCNATIIPSVFRRAIIAVKLYDGATSSSPLTFTLSISLERVPLRSTMTTSFSSKSTSRAQKSPWDLGRLMYVPKLVARLFLGLLR